MPKAKYTIEYPFNSSPKVLFNRLSTASGLSEWFADDVYVNDKTFTFVWDGTEQKAEMLTRKTPEIVKFKWLEIEEEPEEDEEANPYFEFRIRKDDLTGETALLITDFASDDDKEEAIELWDTQINALKHKLGL